MSGAQSRRLLRHALVPALAGLLFGAFGLVYSRYSDHYSMTRSLITAIAAGLSFGVGWGWLMWAWLKRQATTPPERL